VCIQRAPIPINADLIMRALFRNRLDLISYLEREKKLNINVLISKSHLSQFWLYLEASHSSQRTGSQAVAFFVERGLIEWEDPIAIKVLQHEGNRKKIEEILLTSTT
jgi:hypothetical protein